MKHLIRTLLVSVLLSFGFAFVSAQVSDASSTSVDNTYSFACLTIGRNLHYLSRDTNDSTDVFLLQIFLNDRGYLKVEPTGFFGSVTRRAVIAFQKDNNLHSNPAGYVGPSTRGRIHTLDCIKRSSPVYQYGEQTTTTPQQ